MNSTQSALCDSASVAAKQPEKFLATVPFQGFCDSIHSASIDICEERNLEDDCGRISEGVCERYWGENDTDYRMVFTAYAKAYTESLADAVGIKLEFESLQSPHEYNFSTDRIFAYITAADLVKLIAATPRDLIDKAAKENFTSRSGFISSYSPNVSDWGHFPDYDHNQAGTILQAACEHNDIQEDRLVEDFSGSGLLDDWLYDAMGPKCRRLLKISDYLRERQAR